MNLKKKLKRLYYRIVNSDPVYSCPVYKEEGCALVDSYYCPFPACSLIDEHLGKEWTCCAACRYQDECSSSQFGLGCFHGTEWGKDLKKYRILFADLDGTLIETASGETFPKGIWDMKLKMDVLERIREMEPEFLLVVSNQGGIETGHVDRTGFSAKMEYVSRCVKEYCGCEVFSMYCTSNSRDNKYRKPNPGMLEHLCVQHVGDDLEHIRTVSLMIGDASGKKGQFSDSDRRCAENFGIDYMDVDDFVKLKTND